MDERPPWEARHDDAGGSSRWSDLPEDDPDTVTNVPDVRHLSDRIIDALAQLGDLVLAGLMRRGRR